MKSTVTAIALALSAFASIEAYAQGAPQKMMTIQMPEAPALVPVKLNPATTAVLVSDMIDPICKSQPKCVATMIPLAKEFIARARKAGVMIVYSTQEARKDNWMPDVAPLASDPFIASKGQDRFYDTQLEKVLKDKGVQTLVIIGWKNSGSVLYTSIGATLRGLTVVVGRDAALGPSAWEEAIGDYQMLTQSSANATNEPLKTRATTLSRTDWITFN